MADDITPIRSLRLRAEAAEAEVERRRDDPCRCYHCPRCGDAEDSLREGYDQLQTEIERLEDLVAEFRKRDQSATGVIESQRAEVERLRGALDRVEELAEQWTRDAAEKGRRKHVFADGLRAVLRDGQ